MIDTSVPWYEAPKGSVYLYLGAYIDGIIQASSDRYTDYVRFAALYGNWQTAQLASMFTARGNLGPRRFKRLSFNICMSLSDTVINQRAAEAPDVMAVSTDGDYRAFVQARLATQAIRAELKRSNHDMKFPRVVHNAVTFGNGYAGVERGPDGIKVGRIFAPEIVADPNDTVVDNWPGTISHVRHVNKYTLMSVYPQFAAAIANAAADPQHQTRVRGDDNIRVDETWLLAQNGKPGRHVCCIATADLVDEPYEYSTPPFVSLPWGLPYQGWYSQGLIEQLVGLQLEINDVLEMIHEALRLFGHPIMFIENGSNVNLAHIQNIPGKLVKYTNTMPHVVAPQLLSPEVYQHLERCYQKAYEIAGINPYAAQAKTLPRYESSKAMRMATEQGEVRHFNFGQACQRYHTDLAALICREAALAAEDEDYKTRVPRSQYFQDIPWREIDYSIEKFAIEIDTVNKAADSTASRVQDLQDLAQLQVLSVEELRRYLENPDIKRVLHTMTAASEYTDWVIYKLAYAEEYIAPDPFMDLGGAYRACVAEYLNGLRLGMSQKAKTNLLDYIIALKKELDDAQQQQMIMAAKAQAQAQMMQAPVQQQLALNQPGSQQ